MPAPAPTKPIVTLPPTGTVPLKPASATVKRVPPATADVPTSVAFQAEAIVQGAVKPSFQPGIGVVPPLVSLISPPKPLLHCPVTVNATVTPWPAGAMSSSRIVPTALAWASVAPCGAERTSEKVSLDSVVASPITATLTSAFIAPGANVTVPLVAVKSRPATAVPSAVE